MEFKSFMEALKGKQHKIDKNKNGKVDAHDFELLRKEESELNEGTADELGDSIDNAKSTENAKSIIAKAPTKHLQYLHHWNMGLSGARTHKDMPHIKAELTSRKAVLSNAESSKRFDEQVDLEEALDPSEVAGNPRMYSADTVKKAYYHKSVSAVDRESLARHLDRHHGNKEWRKSIEEATVKTQKYSWGTMKTVHQGSNFSIPLHPEHHKEIAKLKDQQEHKFKTEDGKHWTAKRSGDDVHFQSANNGPKTTVKHSAMSESVEDLDEIHRMKTKLNKLDDISNKSVARQKLSNLMKSGKARGALIANKMRTLNMGDDLDQEDLDALYEVLSKDAKAGDYISDFVHSTNPKFEGKSKKERINMALGAYYDTHKKKDGMSEGYYEKPASAYRRKGDEVRDPTPVAPVPDRKYIKGTPENKALKASRKPINGMPTEEVEQIEEKSDQAKQNKTMKNMMDASRGARYKLNNPVPDAEPEHKTAQAHNKAIGRALRSEDKMTTTKDKSGKLVSFKYEGDWKKSTEKKQGSGKAANLAGQAMQTMSKANKNFPMEEVEQIDELDKSTLKSYINKNIKSGRADDGGKGDTGLYRATNKVAGKLKTGTLEKKVKTLGNTSSNAHKNPYEYDASRSELKNRGVHHFAGRRTRTEELNMEAKDEQEYGYEGDMALNQLATLTRCAEMIKEILKPDTDMPEWVQSKITLATDYIQTAADYMHSEMNEAKSVTVKVNHAGDAPHEEKWEPVKKIKKPVEEAVQKVDIPAYLRKAKGDTPLKMDDLKRKDTISDPENLKKNRLADSFDNEGNLISNKVSYKDFINEIKLADLPSRRIQGHSYGANYSDPEGADDYDDKKPMKPAAEKRGRGRPAGAKSGARKITGTSKLTNK